MKVLNGLFKQALNLLVYLGNIIFSSIASSKYDDFFKPMGHG
jgi:hypothetical protein